MMGIVCVFETWISFLGGAGTKNLSWLLFLLFRDRKNQTIRSFFFVGRNPSSNGKHGPATLLNNDTRGGKGNNALAAGRVSWNFKISSP